MTPLIALVAEDEAPQRDALCRLLRELWSQLAAVIPCEDGIAALEAVADKVESALQDKPEREISTEEIGACVMAELKQLDKVAFVRFASVYRNFRDLDEFRDELNDLLRTRE